MNKVSVFPRMRQIAIFAAAHSQFYKDKYKNIDLEKIELPNGLPIIEQQELSEHPMSMKSDEKAFKVVGSSGTMGKPKKMFRTEEDFNHSVNNEIRLMKLCGVTNNDCIGIVQPSGFWGYSDLTEEASRIIGATFIQLGSLSDELCIDFIFEHGITVLDIAPSRLIRLLNWYEQHSNLYNTLPLRIIMLSGEVLNRNLKEYISQKYRVQIYDQYGSEELDGLGGNDGVTPGFRMFEDDYIFEILDDSNQPVANGEVGHLVVTSLYHKGTPLIRYNLNDLARRKGDNIEILGRNCDYVLLYDSVKLYSYQIETVLYGIISEKRVKLYQVVVTDKDIICIQLNLDCDGLSEQERQLLEERLPTCSIDVGQLYKNKLICFQLGDGNQIQISKRGKVKKMIDLRERQW